MCLCIQNGHFRTDHPKNRRQILHFTKQNVPSEAHWIHGNRPQVPTLSSPKLFSRSPTTSGRTTFLEGAARFLIF